MIAGSFLVALAIDLILPTTTLDAMAAPPNKKMPSNQPSNVDSSRTSSPGRAIDGSNQSGAMLSDLAALRDQADDKDRQLCDRARYGTNVDRWCKSVDRGDWAGTKRAWRAVLEELKSCRRIWLLLLDLRLRWCLADEDSKIDRHDMAFHKNLISDTEEAVGRDHRFVADVLVFCANYFENCGNAEEAISACRRALEIRSKTFGKDAAETVGIKYVLAEYLYKLKRYSEAERFFNDFATSCQKLKERDALLDGIRRYAATMRRCGRVKDAYALEAKYGIMMK